MRHISEIIDSLVAKRIIPDPDRPEEFGAYAQGYDARAAGEQYDNPYPANTRQADLWEEGWQDHWRVASERESELRRLAS